MHSKLTPASDEKLNVGVGSLVAPLGPPVIVVLGGVVSTVKEREAGVGSVCPARSIACTANECWPSGSEFSVSGEVHPANGPPSTEHRKVEFGSLELNSKVGVLSLIVEPFAGPFVIVVFGATVSTAKEREAGVWS